MSNILEYVKNNKYITLNLQNFNEVDSLVLSQLAYIKFEKINNINQFEPKISDLIDNILILTKNTRDEKNNVKLLKLLHSSERFKNLKISNVKSIFNSSTEEQFCAITFKITDDLYYIAFRGTDSSLIGWKEDYNLSFLKNIPSQISALNYFNNISEKYKNVNFIIGGHSKGGNLAVYSAIFCEDFFKKRIIKIYDHDGPGFLEEILISEKFNSIKDKIEKTVPKTAIVGLLFEQHSNYKVVDSDGIFMFQHNPYNWKTKNNSFYILKEIDSISQYTNKTINKWLTSTTLENRMIFINSLYNIIYKTNVTTFPELWSNINNYKIIINELQTIEPEIKKIILDTIKELIKILSTDMKLFFLDKFNIK